MNEIIEKNRLIELIYETAEDLELWPKLLDEMDKAGESAEFIPSSLDLLLAPSSNVDQDYWVHIQRAFRLAQKMANVRDESGAVKHFLRRLPVGVIDVTDDGLVMECNDVAESILRDSNAMSIRDNQLVVKNKTDSQNLIKARQSALSGVKNVSVVISETNSGPLTIHVIRSNSVDLKKSYCTLLLTAGSWQVELSEQELKEKYKMTPAEIRLSKYLVQGLTLAEIADEIGVRIHTVRNQLKSIFSKTGTSRQSELVSRLLSSQTISEYDEQENSTPVVFDFPDPATFKTFNFGDSITLNYFEVGDPNGQPLVYLHDFVLWNWWTIVGEKFFTRNKIKLIVIVRPGYFKSSIESSFSFENWAFHCKHFFDELNLNTFHCLGFSSGGAFALALAKYLPENIKKLSVVSGSAPFESISDLNSIQPSMTRLLLAFARYTPSVYKKMLSSLLATAYSKNSDYVKDYISQWSDYDRKKMEIPCYLESFNAAFRAVANANLDGLANEGVIGARNWGFDLEQVNVNVDVWRGNSDRATSQYLSQRMDEIPGAQINVLKGVGHLLIADYAEAILSSLLERDVS